MASCRASAICIASGAPCHKRVLPSMSVNRNVNVPLGNGVVEASARVLDGIGWCAIRQSTMRAGVAETHYQCGARKAYHGPTRLNLQVDSRCTTMALDEDGCGAEAKRAYAST